MAREMILKIRLFFSKFPSPLLRLNALGGPLSCGTFSFKASSWSSYPFDLEERSLKKWAFETLSTPLDFKWPFARYACVKAGTNEGACSRSTLLQHAPETKQGSLALTISCERNIMLRNKTFAPEFSTTLISNCCTSLFQEQAPSCVLKFACRDITCLQLANNQIGL